MRKSALLLLMIFVAPAIGSSGQTTLGQQRADVLFQSGLDRMEHRQYGAAYDAFGQFLENREARDARVPEAEYYRAFCSVTLLHGDGEKQLNDFIGSHPGHPRSITAYYDLGNFFYEEKNYTKAATCYGKVNFQSLDEEKSHAGRFRWGYSLFSTRNLLGAMDQFNTIKASGGTYGPASSYYSGFVELSVGDYENALLDFKRAEKSSSYSAVVPPLIATTYQRQGKDDALIAYAEPLLTREDMPTDELALLTAEAWFRKGNYSKALERYETYLDDRESAGRGVYYRAGYAAWSLANDDQAIAFLKQAASDADSTGMYASYLLGTVYLKRKEKAMALTAFETSKKFKQDPRLAEESLFLSAKINYDLGRSDDAIREFEDLLKLNPNSIHAQEIKELLAQAYINANNVNKALEYIESLSHRSITVERAYQKAAYLKGTEHYNKEEYALAASMLVKSIQVPIDPLILAEASFWLGETYAVGRRYEESVPYYEKALSQPGLPADLLGSTRYGLGYARYNLQQYDKAHINFKDFVQRGSHHPAIADGLLRLADCQYVLKAYPEALASYRRVVQLKTPDSEYARLQCGIVLGIQRQYSEAETELTFVARMPGSRYSEEARFQLGQLATEQGNYTSAANHFTTLIQQAPLSRFTPYAYVRRATANYNLKRYELTADDYITVINKYPGHPAGHDVLLPLQEALRLAGRPDEFEGQLARYKQANPDAKGIETVEFESAKNSYFNQQYPKAIEALTAFLRNYPQSALATEAKYYQAESFYRQRDFAHSLDVHREVLADQSFPMISKSLARAAELEFKLLRYDEALGTYRKLSVAATNKKEEYTAFNGLMESYFLLAQYDSAEACARKIQQLGSVNPSAQTRASLFLGKCAKARGDYETAKDEFLATFNAAQDEYGAEAKYLLAEVFFLTKDHPNCKETLLSLKRDFEAYEEWVGKAFLLLADNYLATNETFQAKGTLKSLIDNFPRADVKALAAERLKAIEKAEQAKQQELIRKDSTEKKP